MTGKSETEEDSLDHKRRKTRLLAVCRWILDQAINNASILIPSALTIVIPILSTMTDWSKSLGILGIFILCASFFFCAMIFAMAIKWMAVSANYRSEKTRAIREWSRAVDRINPLSYEFHTQRIRVTDLVSPIHKFVSGRRFIDCDLVGPANIILLGGSTINVDFINCDLAVKKRGARLFNSIAIKNCEIIGGTISGCTIFVLEKNIDEFLKMGWQYSTPTGRREIESEPYSEVIQSKLDGRY